MRFYEVVNVARLEKDLDQIYIGYMKLHVNVPRYRREVSGLFKEVEKPTASNPGKENTRR